MKTVCKSIFTSCLAGMFTLVAVATTYAQSAPDPAVVVSIASVKSQVAAANYLCEASGFGGAKFFIKSQVRYLANGIDDKRPSGVLMYFKGDNPMPRTVFFVPVKDREDLLDTVSNFAEVDDEEDMIMITPANGQTIFAIEQGTNMFISMAEDDLVDLPEDPQAMLGEMPTKYNLAAHVYGDRVPEELRQSAIDMIKDGYVDSLQNMGGDPDAIDGQIKDFEEQIKVLKEVDEIVVGMLTDEDNNKMAMEFTVVGKPGSKVAKSYEGFANVDATRFAGFMNDKAAMDYSMRFDVSKDDTKAIGKQMDSLVESMMTELDNDGEFSDEELDTIRSAAVQIGEVIEETFTEGRIDSGGQLMMGENDFNFTAGGQVADPKKVESAVKELSGLLKEKFGDAMKFNLDFAKHEGVNLHEIVINIPEDEEEMQDFLGSEVVVILGIGEKDLYVAAGKSPLEALKTAMGNSASAAPEYPVIYNVRVTPILEYVASTTGEPMVDGFVEKLKEVGRDKITVYSKAIENGLFTRMEMEDGPLSLIQGAVSGMQQMGGGADF